MFHKIIIILIVKKIDNQAILQVGLLFGLFVKKFSNFNSNETEFIIMSSVFWPFIELTW